MNSSIEWVSLISGNGVGMRWKCFNVISGDDRDKNILIFGKCFIMLGICKRCFCGCLALCCSIIVFSADILWVFYDQR